MRNRRAPSKFNDGIFFFFLRSNSSLWSCDEKKKRNVEIVGADRGFYTIYLECIDAEHVRGCSKPQNFFSLCFEGALSMHCLPETTLTELIKLRAISRAKLTSNNFFLQTFRMAEESIDVTGSNKCVILNWFLLNISCDKLWHERKWNSKQTQVIMSIDILLSLLRFCHSCNFYYKISSEKKCN